MNPRDTDARLRSDASARELGCTTAIAAMIITLAVLLIYGGLLAYLVWRVVL